MPTILPQVATLLEARKLNAAGYWITPCKSKRPTIKDWPNRRVSDKELAQHLKADPSLGIALVLNQSDLIDVECDTPEAKQALSNLFGGKRPLTPTWKSDRGEHRLFLRPSGLPKKAKLEFDGIEFRIANGKAANSVVPPSGGREWLRGLSIHEIDPAPLPEHITAKLRASSPKVATTLAGVDAADSICEGNRNDTLFQKGLALKPVMTGDLIVEALLKLNARQCVPPLPEDEVRAIAASVINCSQPKVGFLERLLGEVELWHDENDDPFGTLEQNDHRENWKIGKRSRPFKRYLSKRFYDTTKETLTEKDLGEICSLLEGRAVFDGQRYKLFRRVAEDEGKIYLDLCNDRWQAVEVDANGWRLIDDPPVKFFRARAMKSLPIPVKPGKAETLKSLLTPLLNIRVDQYALVAGWLVAALRPRGPYPLLKIFGEQGSAKTTMARVLRDLVDPNAAPVRAEPKSTRDLAIQANNAWVVNLDNTSSMSADLSDALCRLSTGGGFSTRTLYSDDEETIFEATRPVIITAIEEIGTRSDLMERSIILELPTIPEEKRRAEKQFWADFEAARPKILGALLDAVACAIKNLPEIESRSETNLSRLADFEQWAEAAEPALGLDAGAFVEAYRANREHATQIVLEASPVVTALLALLDATPTIKGTATELLDRLGSIIANLKAAPGWPKTPRVLSQILRRVAPNLRQIGIAVEQISIGKGDDKRKGWEITGPEKSSQADPEQIKKRKVRDA